MEQEILDNPRLLKNPELAYIVASITGDGHLQKQRHRYLVSFYSKEWDEIESMQRKFHNVFKVEGRVYVDKRKTIRYKLFFMSKEVASFLHEVGTPVGNKTNIHFPIPQWVMGGSARVRGAYLQGLFDSEGSVFCRNANTIVSRWQISFKMAKNEKIIDSGLKYLNQIQMLLSQFHIHSSPINIQPLNLRKDGSMSFELWFRIEKSSFGNFYKYVGFGNKRKQEKLVSALRG